MLANALKQIDQNNIGARVRRTRRNRREVLRLIASRPTGMLPSIYAMGHVWSGKANA